MSTFEFDTTATPDAAEPIPQSDIDRILTAQLVVAWAGEGGEEKRLGWWRSDLVSEFGGEDLFARLLPHTWQWAVLQGAREAARRKDAELRRRDHNPDRILSLYSLGFHWDELLDERLQELKQSGLPPEDALPGLRDGIETAWHPSKFSDWLAGQGHVETIPTPTGRRIKGEMPGNQELIVRRLIAGLLPLTDQYPLPHFRTEA